MQDGKRPVIRKRFPWGWLAVGALVLLVAGGSYARKHAPIALAVTTPTIYKAGERNHLVTASGYIVARHRATLSAKVPGRIEWLGVEEGTKVTKGQVIARLEDPDIQAAYDQVDVNLAQAELDLKRGEALWNGGVLDLASVEKLRAAERSLTAQRRYQASLLENMVLRAPFTGTVTQKLSEVGETVSPGSAGGANAINAVAILDDFDSLELEVEVNETSITKLRKDMPAEIRVDALDAEPNAKPLKGQLRAIYPSSNRQKAVVLVRVSFLEKSGFLVPDMGAKVTFLGAPYPTDVVILGREQVVRRQGQTFVWVLEGDRAQLHPITVGAENPVGLEVTGLAPDARLLVVPPDTRLEPGARVSVKAR